MAARDNSRRDAEYDDTAHGDVGSGDAERGDLVFDDGAERAGLAHDGVQYTEDVRYDGPAYAGMDALMAALLDEPLPEDARRDAEFVASRDAAVADIAVLREQLGLIGEALAVTGAEAEAVAGVPPGRRVAARPGDAAGAGTDPGHVPGPAAASVASVRPLLPRPARARRVLKVAFGTLAAAAAASVVFGVGWVVVQADGAASTTSSDSGSGFGSGADQQDESQAGGQENGLGDGDSDGRPSHVGYLACARLVVEGTVTGVEPVAGAGQDRITVGVDRYYKPAKGPGEVVFPMAEDVDPRLRKGDHVLIGIPRDSAVPDLWTVGERKIAGERAWIEEALPDTEGMECE